MPSLVRQVNFSPSPLYSRLPRDDELYVMNTFASHAKRCPQCEHPLATYLNYDSLCEKGITKAKDVAQYVLVSNGRAYSKIDSEGTQRVHVEIPAGCEPVRELLRALERGMQLKYRAVKHTPVVSYDPNYYVAPRPAPVREITPAVEQQYVTIEPSSTNKRRDGHRREKVYIPGRGSLYDSDMAERKQRREENIVYYEAKPRGARGGKTHHR